MPATQDATQEQDVPWFAGEPGELLVFRVNRRPLEPNLFTSETKMPPDVFEHFRRVLAPGYEVVTGRGYQRTWRVGGVRVSQPKRVLTGKLNWLPRGEEVAAAWSEEEKDWISSPMTPRGGRIMPFGFDGETRLLTVIRDRRSAPATIALVFEKILRDNEAELPVEEQTTEWSVEPVLDARDFLEWLKNLDVIASVSFTARLPNPEPKDAFKDLADRIDARNATQYTESFVSEREGGLTGIQEDRDFRQAIAMGEHGFATLRGRGERDGHGSRYSQRNKVATEHVEELPKSWDAARTMLTDYLKDRLRRFLEEDDVA